MGLVPNILKAGHNPPEADSLYPRMVLGLALNLKLVMTEKKEDLSFGTLAGQLGYITSERIKECLQIQQKIKELGVEPKPLGEILIDKGYLTEVQAKHIFRVQGSKGGHTQISGYKIISRLGQGAMGYVYKAWQISMERLVAIKVLTPHLAQNEKFVERFLREARSVARLNHPNIIQGIDVAESNGIYYFAMEYIDGPTIENVVKKNGPLEEKKSLKIIIQVSRALDHAHQNNIIHRDIKPANIMITKSGIIKLCDLGLAKLLVPDSRGPTEGRMTLGTPAYISPEQARADIDVDIRSDIYSLGATLYFMVTGQGPFPSDSAAEAIAKHLSQKPLPPKQKNPVLSEWTDQLVLKMMSKQKENRPQTPAELIKNLEMILQNLDKEEIITLKPEEPGLSSAYPASPHQLRRLPSNKFKVRNLYRRKFKKY